jgi:type I site-specific restriction endonuclease
VITEADTCRKYVLPKLYAAGWNDDQISEQKSFTDGRIVVVGAKGRRRASGKKKGSGVFSVHESAKPLRTFLKYQY